MSKPPALPEVSDLYLTGLTYNNGNEMTKRIIRMVHSRDIDIEASPWFFYEIAKK